MISFLVCDKGAGARPQRNPAYQAVLADLKRNQGAYSLASAAKRGRSESAKGLEP